MGRGGGYRDQHLEHRHLIVPKIHVPTQLSRGGNEVRDLIPLKVYFFPFGFEGGLFQKSISLRFFEPGAILSKS